MPQYQGLDIDPERGWDDTEQQIRELETHELLALYDMFANNPTPFQMIAEELGWREENNQKLSSESEAEQIRERMIAR